MATLIDGRFIGARMLRELQERISRKHLHPGLAAILVGSDPASQIYVRLKEKAAKEIGMTFERHELVEQATEAALLETIASLNKRADVHGILLQLPLPKHLDPNRIVNAISPEKDADGFLPHARVQPVMAQVVKTLLEETGQSWKNKTALIITKNADIFGAPLQRMMEDLGAVASTVSPDATDLFAQTKKADVLVSAVGRAHFIQPQHIKPGATLVDIGVSKTPNGTAGDIDPTTDDVAAWRTPVPGGVGPVTVATLLKNVVTLCEQQTATS